MRKKFLSQRVHSEQTCQKLYSCSFLLLHHLQKPKFHYVSKAILIFNHSVIVETPADPDSCYNLGECHESTVVGASPDITLETCQQDCQNHASCQYFTWYEQENECLFFSDCNFNSTSCADCYTGTAYCSLYDCFEPGVCINSILLDHDYFTNPNDCLQYCQSNPECQYFSHDPNNNNICALTSDCQNISTACVSSGCVYGQAECKSDTWHGFNIMVATGWNDDQLKDAEMINTETVTSCPNRPAAYPLALSDGVALKHDSKMVICSGRKTDGYRTTDCYSYSNDQWTLEPYKLEPERFMAMSTEIRPGEWLCMGGYGDAGELIDTKLFKNGIFTQGPTLPEPIQGGSSVMLNKTHLFVAGADNGGEDFSQKNYLLEIDTNQWTQIADRNVMSYPDHSSGIFYNSTAGEIQVANIGRFGIEVYSPSSDSWHQVLYPLPLTYLMRSAAIQQGTDSFILIGGYTNLNQCNDDVYLFDENGFSTYKNNVLRVARESHVAMPISKDFFTCN